VCFDFISVVDNDDDNYYDIVATTVVDAVVVVAAAAAFGLHWFVGKSKFIINPLHTLAVFVITTHKI
jgi:hypothetical protein